MVKWKMHLVIQNSNLQGIKKVLLATQNLVTGHWHLLNMVHGFI
jgi:hypothetical protein